MQGFLPRSPSAQMKGGRRAGYGTRLSGLLSYEVRGEGGEGRSGRGSGGPWCSEGCENVERVSGPPASPNSPSLLRRKSLQMLTKSPRLERVAEQDEDGSESLVLVSKVGRAVKTRRAGGRRRKLESSKEAAARDPVQLPSPTSLRLHAMS
jgi:hypothetical protein